MKTKYILKGFLFALLMSITISSCSDYDLDVIDELMVDRTFAPIALKAIVRNQTTVELNWTTKKDVEYYVVEFSADDPNFTTIFKSIIVKATQLPFQVALEGETVYSIRVKAKSSVGLEDSTWAIVKATTLTEQIMLPSLPGDVKVKEAIFRWTPNSNVTHIVVNPGNISYTITTQEKVAGIATVTGLTSETSYTAKLYNNTKIRGTSTFTTGIDIGNGILVKPTDDLFQKITDAASGAILVLEPGDYTAQTGEVALSKSITIRGLRSYDKPRLKVKFTLNAGTANLSLIDLNLTSDAGTNTSVITVSGASTNYGEILISGCLIQEFERSLIAANASGSKVALFTVENSIIKNVNTNAGADFIDFRNTYVASVILKNSTFDNCSAGRDFIRIDAVAPASGFSGTGLTSNVLVDSCTLYKVSDGSGKRILYVRFNANVLTVKNNLFAETAAIYSNQSTTADPTFLNNNYFNAPNLFATATKFDNSGTYTTLNPGFVNAASSNFKITNQTLLDNKVGDPRWR
jgi:hypothetical protein